MATDPISGARYPQESDSGDVALHVQRAVNDLSPKTIPTFATATARDNAYSAAITAGTISAIPDGARCSVNGVPYRRINGAWRENRQRVIWRQSDFTASPRIISTGGANQSGVTPGIAALPNFTLYEAGRVYLTAVFRVGPNNFSIGANAALCYVIIDGTNSVTTYSRVYDNSVPILAGVDLAAGSHTLAFRVEAFGFDVVWTNANLVLVEGAVE